MDSHALILLALDLTMSKMDPRCPKQLECLPDTWCELAVLRLKAVRNAGRELTEEEEARLPGCPWSIDHQLANYCFFKYMSDFADGKAPSDMEIAAFLNVSVDTVKKIEKTALDKVKKSSEFSSLTSDDIVDPDRE